MRTIHLPIWFFLVAAVLGIAGLRADEPSDWPTIAGNMQRTAFAPIAPAPPYQARWYWVNGKRAVLKKGQTVILPGDLPNFYTVRFSAFAQPMVKDGIAYIGSTAGELFAIDVMTGENKWKAKASGPILHSVTVGEDAVYTSSSWAVDAFSLDGKKLWSFKDRSFGAFRACPALDRGTVLVGSFTGLFYGLDAKTGNEKWHYDVGAPIFHCPAVDENAVYFGAEDMHAYALNTAGGKLLWKSERLHGITFGHYWPVVAAKQGVVIFRTAPVLYSGAGPVARKGQDNRQAQEALRKYLLEDNPHARTLYILNLKDGKERVQVAAGYVGMDDIPALPIVRDDGSILAWYYARDGAMQKLGAWSGYSVPADFGIIDLKTGYFKLLGPTGSTTPPAITRNDDFHWNSMGGKYLFGIQHGLHWGVVSIDGKGTHTPNSLQRYWLDMNKNLKRGTVWVRNDEGHVAPTLLKDAVLVQPACGLYIACYESAPTKGK
jgi:outer membrane protein assembly factor BamB